MLNTCWSPSPTAFGKLGTDGTIREGVRWSSNYYTRQETQFLVSSQLIRCDEAFDKFLGTQSADGSPMYRSIFLLTEPSEIVLQEV